MKATINDLIILGRAAPDTIGKDRRKSYCVAGYSHSYGFIRMYPTSKDCPMRVWNLVEVPFERNPQDTRDESWKIQGSKEEWDTLEEKITVLGRSTKKNRRQLCFNLLDGCRDDINDAHRSLGIVKPATIEGFFKERKALPKEKQRELWEFLGLSPPKNHFIMTKEEFEHVPYVKYICSNCRATQGYHEQQLLSIEAYEWMRKNPDNINQLWENFHIKDPEYDVYLFIGNQKLYRTSYMVISILRFKKSNYPLKKAKLVVPLKKVEKFLL